MYKLNILIIEDEVLIANLTKKYITEAGYNCVGIAIDFYQAMAILKQETVDFVIIDVTLSQGESGIKIAQYINDNYSIPFMYLTSHSDFNTLQNIEKTKPVAYLSKPIKKVDLITALRLNAEPKISKALTIFSLNLGKSTFKINLNQLVYVKSEHVYTRLFFKDQDNSLLVRSTLNNLIKLLPENTLTRINRSIAINKAYIKKVSPQSIEVDTHTFKLSEAYSTNLNL